MDSNNNNNKNYRQIVDAPLRHYTDLYAQSDAVEIAARTALSYDEARKRFTVPFVGIKYYVTHPDFMVIAASDAKQFESLGKHENGAQGDLRSPYETILLIRYLLEGKYAPFAGAMLAYSEMPWGAVYNSQFNGRVISRLAREFGREPALLEIAASRIPGTQFERRGGADAGCRLALLPGLFISVLLWAGDDEFPASAQMLFGDNFKYAFTAEDMAVCGDVVISRLKHALK